MKPYYEIPDGRAKLYLGDTIEVMASFPDACVDAIITDPPYGLEFMGKEWDAPWAQRIGLGEHNAGFGAVELADGADRLPWPTYLGGTNPSCRNCGGTRFGQEKEGGRKRCRCDSPDFPNIALPRAVAYQSWTTAWATEAYRILKPGAYMLVMGGTRTHHRLGCGLEDAGFEIRDELAWIYASGFPKNYDVSKGIDKKAGAEREVVGEYQWPDGQPRDVRTHKTKRKGIYHDIKMDNSPNTRDITQPATPEAQYWEGYGTALKPAHEPVWLCKKPNEGTYVDNVLKHGCGAMNIDGCRVEYQGERDKEEGQSSRPHSTHRGMQFYNEGEHNQVDRADRSQLTGRWPANVLVDCYPEEFQGGVVIEGEAQLGKATLRRNRRTIGDGNIYQGGAAVVTGGHDDITKGDGLLGPYTRFFVIPKPSKKEKTCGGKVENKHVTVKPIRLGMWLIKLITPHRHSVVVLDPFCGSGSFLVSGLRLNQEQGYQIEMWGIDKDKQSVKTARERLKAERTFQGVLL